MPSETASRRSDEAFDEQDDSQASAGGPRASARCVRARLHSASERARAARALRGPCGRPPDAPARAPGAAERG